VRTSAFVEHLRTELPNAGAGIVATSKSSGREPLKRQAAVRAAVLPAKA
jgi:hypothetical protein